MSDQANMKSIQRIRECEANNILPIIPKGSTIIEIGAGNGYQARILAESGHRIEAVDVEGGVGESDRVWPVKIYDGKHIPFPDLYFDVLFTSNVLEHIRDINCFMEEMRRVLKPDGIAIHIVPSATWRFWTNVFHYIYLVKLIFNKIMKTKYKYEHSPGILPTSHGVSGNFLTEIYYFSRFYWGKLFERNGWKIRKRMSNNLFYTGYIELNRNISIDLRSVLSKILGSSCHIYILT